jgi:cell division protein FtsN
MRTDRGPGGRSAFFGLAMLILGALLFAAGVMVGRQMAVEDSTTTKEPLFKIDQRDKEPKKKVDGGNLSFHEVLDEKKPEPEPAPEPPPKLKIKEREVTDPSFPLENFSLQVAAYGERAQAESLVKKLTEQGYDNPRISEKEVPGKGTYYRVRVGPFTGREEAARILKRLEEELRVKVLLIKEESP